MPGTHLTPTSTSEAWEGFGLINNVSRVTDNSVAAQLPRATGLATAVYIQSWVEAQQRQRSLPGIVGIPPKSFSPRFFYASTIPSGSELETGELASQGYP